MAEPEHSQDPLTTEQSMRLPGSSTTARPLVDFFSRALTTFQRSNSPFQVICTLPPNSSSSRDGTLTPTPLPPKIRPRVLLVLDSSFNPPTRAHLRMATSAVDDLTRVNGHALETLRLLFLLAVNNADKAPKPAAFDQRLAMMWAFARDVQQSLSDSQEEQGQIPIDIALSTQPYFHEKSAAIAQADFYKLGQQDDGKETEQVFLVGYDTLIRIFNPKYYTSPVPLSGVAESPMQRVLTPFLARAKLRVMMRTDDEWGAAADQRAYLDNLIHADGLGRLGASKEWGSRIELVEGRKSSEEVVSSTYARQAAAEGDRERLERMVTSEVRAVVEQEGPYVK